jgi:hypothetical protein
VLCRGVAFKLAAMVDALTQLQNYTCEIANEMTRTLEQLAEAPRPIPVDQLQQYDVSLPGRGALASLRTQLVVPAAATCLGARAEALHPGGRGRRAVRVAA